MSLLISFPVIGLDKFLRTPAASLAAQPLTQLGYWITDSVMAVPLFALSVWVGDLIAARAGIGTARHSDLFKRSLVIALISSLVLAPVWFEINKLDDPIVAQPLVFPQAHDTGDVYSVAPGVIVGLVCVCLVPAAFWAGRASTRAAHRAWSAMTRGAAARGKVTAAAVPALLTVLAPVLAWLMYQAAGHAYASQVYYARSPLTQARRVRPAPVPATTSRLSPPPQLPAAPDAFVSQAAHALQDGLMGQAAGILAAALAAGTVARRKNARTPMAATTARTAQARGDAPPTNHPHDPADKS
jgi:hypothetical protein